MKTIFLHCPRCGSGGLKPQPPNSYTCERCHLHFYINPAIAVSVILLNPADEVLLIRRARDPGKGKLAFPGGFVDAGETAETALTREVREEVGLELLEIEYLTSCPNIYPYKGINYPVLDFSFVGRVDSFDAARALDDVAGLVITPVKEVPADELAFPSLQEAMRVFQRRAKAE